MGSNWRFIGGVRKREIGYNEIVEGFGWEVLLKWKGGGNRVNFWVM